MEAVYRRRDVLGHVVLLQSRMRIVLHCIRYDNGPVRCCWYVSLGSAGFIGSSNNDRPRTQMHDVTK